MNRKSGNRTVRVSVDGVDIGSVDCLSILFKEILQQVPVEDAAKLMKGYYAGRTIVLNIGESAYNITSEDGRQCKTAFRFMLTDSQAWRGLPEAERAD